MLGTLKQLRLAHLIDPQDSPERQRVLALLVARLLKPSSKLATARDSLADTLRLGTLDKDDLYMAMDWLLERQDQIERSLAKRHLKNGALVLYGLTSVYLEGRHCPLAQRGYARDGNRGKLQIEFGLLCDGDGCPVAVEVFDGNTADPMTLGTQIDKLRTRFGLSKVVLVGDRGMLTEARLSEEVKPAGSDWIGALRALAIRQRTDDLTVMRMVTLTVPFFLVQVPARLHQYSLRLTAFWDSRADSVLLAQSFSNQKAVAFDDLVSALAPDAYDFKPPPKPGQDALFK